MTATARFDEAAAQWDSNPTRVTLARAVGDAMSRVVPFEPGWRGLDYGAGTGLLTLNLLPRLASMVAVDSSSGMLETLSRKLSAAGIRNVETRLWNLEEKSLPERGFDVVVSSMTFHHLRTVPLVLNRLVAILRPGGWLAFADLDAEDGSFHGASDDVFHHGFDRQTISVWLKEAGLGSVSVRDAHVVEKPDATGRLRSYSVFLAAGRNESSREP